MPLTKLKCSIQNLKVELGPKAVSSQGDKFLCVCTKTLLQTEAWTQALLCVWFSTLFASTFLAQLCPGPTSTLQPTSGHSWHIAEGKEYSPKFIWMEEKQEHIWAHAVLYQLWLISTVFSSSGHWNTSEITLHCFRLEFMMPLMCLWTFANNLLGFFAHPTEGSISLRKNLLKHIASLLMKDLLYCYTGPAFHMHANANDMLLYAVRLLL